MIDEFEIEFIIFFINKGNEIKRMPETNQSISHYGNRPYSQNIDGISII